MNRTIPLMCACALLALSGCAAINDKIYPPAVAPDWSAICKDEATCKPEDRARRSYEAAMKYCVDKQDEYQKFDFTTSQFRFGIGTVGALAGAVVAPIASGTAAKAWSGLSGAANGIQTGYDQAFSAARETNRRNELGTLINNFGAEYLKPHTADEHYVLSVLYASKCAASAGAADAKAIKAMVSNDK